MSAIVYTILMSLNEKLTYVDRKLVYSMATTQVDKVFLPRRGSKVAAVKSAEVAYSTPSITWRWMWPDILMRIIPMGIVPFLYSVIFHFPLINFGLVLTSVPLHLIVGLLVGIGLAIFAILYRMYVVGPWFRKPTPADQCLQTFFYLFINAPVEEFFFRGFILAIITQWTSSLFIGWFISTAMYVLYHRLGKWNWRSVGGVGLAGIVFSLVYLLLPGPHSLLAVVIIHALTTSGFLSWGDEALYQRWKHLHTKSA